MSRNLEQRGWVEASCDVGVEAFSIYETRPVVHIATDTLLTMNLLTDVIFRGFGRRELDHSGLYTVRHGKISNIEVCDSIICQKTKLFKATIIFMKQINDIRLNTLVIPPATTQLDASTIPIHRLKHGHGAMVLLIQVSNDFFATKKLVNVFQLQALGLREE